ncbi:MAG: hypothetical protein JWP06_1193 [Candidatus Saccharibacteria bacterium]|nr:hypothetical protein [Candidatus Saccharibacteria bacterium]
MELLKEYISYIPLKVSETKQPIIIAMVGLVGAGKSTIAKAIAERTGLYVASNDAIRRFLNEKGFQGASPVQDMLEYIAEAGTAYLLEHRVSHIIDNDLLKFHEQARLAIEAQGFRFYLLGVQCSERTILERLKKRSKDIANGAVDTLSRASKEQYEVRKKVHSQTPQPVFDFIFNTENPLEPQVDTFMAHLRDEKVV